MAIIDNIFDLEEFGLKSIDDLPFDAFFDRVTSFPQTIIANAIASAEAFGTLRSRLYVKDTSVNNLLVDGFETGDLRKYEIIENAANIEVQTAVVRSGKYAAKMNHNGDDFGVVFNYGTRGFNEADTIDDSDSDSSYLKSEFGPRKLTVIFYLRFAVTVAPSEPWGFNQPLLRIESGRRFSNAVTVSFEPLTSGNIRLFGFVNTTTQIGSHFDISPDTWYKIEVNAAASSDNRGFARWSVDDSVKGEASRLTTGRQSTFQGVFFTPGFNDAGEDYDVFIDDVIIRNDDAEEFGLKESSYPAQFRDESHTTFASRNGSITGNKPTGTQDSDILIAFLRSTTGMGTITAPSGWTLLTETTALTSGVGLKAYWKRASGEPSSWNWTWTGGNQDSTLVVMTYQYGAEGYPINLVASAIKDTTTDALFPTISGLIPFESQEKFIVAAVSTETAMTHAFATDNANISFRRRLDGNHAQLACFDALLGRVISNSFSGSYSGGSNNSTAAIVISIRPSQTRLNLKAFANAIASAEIFGSDRIQMYIKDVNAYNILVDGAEFNDFRNFRISQGSPTIQSTVVYAGRYAFKTASGSPNDQFGLVTGIKDLRQVYVKTYIRFHVNTNPDSNINNSTLISLGADGSTFVNFLLTFQSDGVLKLRAEVNFSFVGPQITVNPDQWYKLEFSFITGTTDGSFVWLLDDVVQASASRLNFGSSLIVKEIIFGSLTIPIPPGSIDVYYDDIIVKNNNTESFGSDRLILYIKPSGVGSTEIFGTSTIQIGTGGIFPIGIPSAESFGTPRFILYVQPSGIGTNESFGTPRFILYVRPSGILSAQAFGTPVVTSLARILPTGILSTEVFGIPTLRLYVKPTGISTSEVVNAPFRVSNVVRILPTGILSAQAFGTPKLNFKIYPNSINSNEFFGTPRFVLFVRPSGIFSAEFVSNPFKVSNVVTIAPTGIVSAQAFGSPRLNFRIYPLSINTSEIFGTPTLRSQIRPISITSLEAFGLPTILRLIRPSGIVSLQAFGTPKLNFRILTTGILSNETFGTLTTRLFVRPTGVPTAQAFGTPVTALVQAILPTGIASAQAVGTPRLNLRIYPNSTASQEAFGILKTLMYIRTTGIPTTQAVGIPNAIRLLIPGAITSKEVFGSNTLFISIGPTGISSLEKFGDLLVTGGAFVEAELDEWIPGSLWDNITGTIWDKIEGTQWDIIKG